MRVEHREQGETRQQILDLLRRSSALTAAELSDAIGVGAVGIRQHLALLERESLVAIAGVRRGLGRPSHLYSLTAEAETLFPKSYDRLVMDVLAFVNAQSPDGVEQLFGTRREQLAAQYKVQLAGRPPTERLEALAALLNDQGYMCEITREAGGSYVLTQHNCPIDCVARAYPQACSQEITLYQELLGVELTREETIADGGTCCRYRIDGDG